MSIANSVGFGIGEVFDGLYRKRAEHAFRRLDEALVASDASGETRKPPCPTNPHWMDLLVQSLASQFAQFRAEQRSALAYHASKLASFRQTWKAVRSSATCLSCLKERPRWKLPCRHWICAACFSHFGVRTGAARSLPCCVLCGEETKGLRVRSKPKTASLRILCLDGGGANAGKPLASLKALEDKVGLGSYPVQDHFDVIFGTSSGLLPRAAPGCL